MSLFPSELRPTEITIVVLIFALLVLLPPIRNLWSSVDNVWYLPYLIWLAIIVLAFWLQRLLRKHAV